MLESSLGAGQDARYFSGKLGALGYTRIHVGKPWSIFANIYLGEWHGGKANSEHSDLCYIYGGWGATLGVPST